jgi:hypothetical protein
MGIGKSLFTNCAYVKANDCLVGHLTNPVSLVERRNISDLAGDLWY